MSEQLLTWAEIDLDAIANNVQAYKHHVGDNVQVMAVVKANAYGHGAVPVARTALAHGANRLAVHRLVEGVGLRQEGILAPLLIMGYIPPAAARDIVEWHLTPTVNTLEFAEALSHFASSRSQTVPIHLKIDTGMSRFGLLPEEALDFTRRLLKYPHLWIEGIFTHFSTADSADGAFLYQQLEIFEKVVQSLRKAGLDIPIVHAANSAAAMKYPQANFTAIRPGIGIYGLKPSNEWEPVFPIQPALTLKSRVARFRSLPAGSAVSYGRTYISEKPFEVALVPVGYGDGYPRNLSNRGCVLVHGQRAPILGRVCMDQFVVDVSDIPGIRQDEEVVLIGRQGEACLPAEEIAELAGTINYEITTRLLPRVPRLYLQRGERFQLS